MNSLLRFLNCGLLVILIMYSSDLLAGINKSCDEIKSTMDIVVCARENHPEVKTGKLAFNQSVTLENVAEQRPNPEIEGSFITGKSLGDVVTEAEIKISHILELGGKRDARINNAKSQIEVEKLYLEKVKSKYTLLTVIALYRLIQVKEEIAVLDEAEGTFKKIQRQYKKRGKLNPESEVSLNVFQLAEGDYKLKKLGRSEELRELSNYFEIATGLTLKEVERYLPKRINKWPKIFRNSESQEGIDLKIAKSKVNKALSEVDLAKSESWPDLTISPIYKNSSDGGVSYDSFGIGVSFPLPLFHANGAGRAYAFKGLTQSKINLKLKQINMKLIRANIVKNYDDSVKVLGRSASYKELEKKHIKLERLFQRGLVSSSMVIEAHRQIIEFLHHVHEHSIKAIENLWTVYAIDGKILKESI